MHLTNQYQYPFKDVVSGFIRLYIGENARFTTTTIAHVSQIDENKFQFVRRAENCVTSEPLFERIIVDRQAQRLSGFTFESTDDHKYKETYIYQKKEESITDYNVYLYKDPGLKKWLRKSCHQWGIDNLMKILNADKVQLSEFKKKQYKIKQIAI